MGGDKIRHLIERRRQDGTIRFYWQPSETVQALGLTAEAIGKDAAAARARALQLNTLADEVRRTAKTGENGPQPGTCSRLFADFKASEEFADLKPRTQADYAYYLDKIEDDFATNTVRSLSALVIKTYYKRMRREKSVTWAYHILATFRVVLSWGVSEDWLESNPALDVKMKSPAKRSVIWTSRQAQIYIAKALEMGWHSIVAMAYVFDSIGQSPIDVRTMPRKAYDGRCIDITRAKTGIEGAPIRLFPEAKAALDAYLATQPAKLPDAPMFTHDRVGGMWKTFSLNKVHAKIRTAAGLPTELQFQDFRTTVQTEAGAAGGTVDELRGLARHSTRSAAEHYVYPDGRFVDAVQDKRAALRQNELAKKV